MNNDRRTEREDEPRPEADIPALEPEPPPARPIAQTQALVRRLGVLRFEEMWALLALILLCAGLGIAKPAFLSYDNTQIVLRQISFNAIIAVGMTFVIATAGIDLSVGSVLALSGCVGAMCMTWGVNTWLSVGIGLGMGAFCGLVNGLVVSLTRVPPFVQTLGMMYAARYVAMLLTGAREVAGLPDEYDVLGQGVLPLGLPGAGRSIEVPLPVLIMLGVAVVGALVLAYTRFGRYCVAIGSNEEAVRLSGVRVRRYKLAVYVITGSLAALSGTVLFSRLGAAPPMEGMMYELNAIAACVIGGASLMGGQGTVLGTIIGAMIIGVLPNGLVHLGVSQYWQPVVVGVVIVLAVLLDTWRRGE
ncbi:MAG: ABC transporter permease [Armatimonadota bacterium]|jgi:ribose transport system permease protein